MGKNMLLTRWIIATVTVILCFILAVGAWDQVLYQQADRNSSLRYVEKGDHYAVYSEDGSFYCSIFNSEGQIAKTDGPFIMQPSFKEIDGRIVRVSWQGGTGMGTQFAYYYDIEHNVFSQTFQSVFDEYGGKVVCCTENKVIVQDIFNKGFLYLEITEFEKPFSKMAFPFENVCFTDEGTTVRVTYYSGDDYQLVSEEIPIVGQGTVLGTGDGSVSQSDEQTDKH